MYKNNTDINNINKKKKKNQIYPKHQKQMIKIKVFHIKQAI